MHLTPIAGAYEWRVALIPRHTFASRLRMHGVELATTLDLPGHTTTRMTDRYAHIAPGHLHVAVDRISRTGTSEGPAAEPVRAVAAQPPDTAREVGASPAGFAPTFSA